MVKDQQLALQMLEEAFVAIQIQLQVQGRLINQNIKKLLKMENCMTPTTTSNFHQGQYLCQ
eukprot:11760191-Prorocentrum_lima.AAC.1